MAIATSSGAPQKTFWQRVGYWFGKDKRGRRTLFPHEALAGWMFMAPFLIGAFVFIVVPIIYAVIVSTRDWGGLTPPLQSESVGLDNFKELLIEDGLRRQDFAYSLRNNFYYVVFIVPMQTVIAFLLAFVVHQKFLKGRDFFRLAFFFPSITSSIAVAAIFKFLFGLDGLVNSALPGKDVNWFADPSGVLHNVLGLFGVERGPDFLTDHSVMSLSLWEWVSGPSVAMLAIIFLNTWTTSGTLMLIFLGGLQSVPEAVDEAAIVDGANLWQRAIKVTMPMLRPQVYLVVTLGIIGTWQVFDQIYALSFGGPEKTTLTPAFLIYFQMFKNGSGGLACAVAVLLAIIIFIMTRIQKLFMSDQSF